MTITQHSMTQPGMEIGVETQARSGGPTVLQPPSQAFNPFIVRKSFEIFDCRYEPVASWCSGILKALNESRQESARIKALLDQTQYTLELELEDANQKLKKSLKANSRLEDQVSAAVDLLAELEEERDDWRSRYKLAYTDLHEALRMLNDEQLKLVNDLPPAYGAVLHQDLQRTGPQQVQSFDRVLWSQHMANVALAVARDSVSLLEISRLLADECRQLVRINDFEPNYVANTVIALITHTLSTGLWCDGTNWSLYRVEIQRYWCIIDENLVLFLQRSLKAVVIHQSDTSAYCEEENTVPCFKSCQWIWHQARLTMITHQADQLDRIRTVVRERVEDAICESFLADSEQWLREVLEDERRQAAQCAKCDCPCRMAGQISGVFLTPEASSTRAAEPWWTFAQSIPSFFQSLLCSDNVGQE